MMDDADVIPVRECAPKKPGMTLLVPCALLFWSGCCATYTCSLPLEIDDCAYIVCLCSLLAGIALCLSVNERIRYISVLLSMFMLGCAVGSYGAFDIKQESEKACRGSSDWALTLISDAKPNDFGESALAEAVSQEGLKLKVALNLPKNTNMLRGEKLSAHIRFTAVKEESKQFRWNQGVAVSGIVDEYEPIRIEDFEGFLLSARRSAIEGIEAYAGERAPIMQALACGYRNSIEESGSYENYKTCGLAHLVAVSGAHLAIVTMMLLWLFEKIRLPRIVASAFTIAFLMAYLVFSGIPISAIRATCMVFLSVLSPIFGRRNASLNSLAICIVAFLVSDPSVSVSASFVLSAGSTLGIILFCNLIISWFAWLPKRLKPIFAEPLGMTFSSNIATLPYSVALFSQLPLISPLANLVAAPLFLIACTTSLLGAVICCLYTPVAAFAIPAVSYATLPLVLCTDMLAQIPYSCVAVAAPVLPMIILSVVAMMLLWIIWPRLGKGGVIAIFLTMFVLGFSLCFLRSYAFSDQIIMLDVGQGDAFLIRSKESSLLIDTGNQDSLLRRELAEAGVTKLDAVLITHPDDDHCASLKSLSGYVSVESILCANDLLSCDCENCSDLKSVAYDITDNVEGMEVGDKIGFDNFEFEVIWPERFEDAGGNQDSLCLKMVYDGNSDGDCDWSAVFLGDAESDEVQRMIDSGRLGHVDILKVGHHGSKVSLTQEIADELDPEIALISCGKNNRYGHPSREILDILSNDVEILRTDERGTVGIDLNADSISVD